MVGVQSSGECRLCRITVRRIYSIALARVHVASTMLLVGVMNARIKIVVREKETRGKGWREGVLCETRAFMRALRISQDASLNAKSMQRCDSLIKTLMQSF